MLISLILRWFGWVVALLIVLLKGAPPENLEGSGITLAVTALVLCSITVYPHLIRDHLPPSFGPYVWPPLDCLIAAWSVYQTGGWDSPFYHFAVTVVLAPSLQFGLSGALLSTSFFTAAFFLAVGLTPLGFSPAYTATGQAEPDLVSTPLNPLMIALYAAFLGEVLQKLQRETERSKVLAAENERARMSRDIHDGVSQTLFMLGMSLENGTVLAQKEQAHKTREHLEKLIPVAGKALIELRNAMHDVAPLAEGRQTLYEALTHLARDYRSATGINIEVEAVGNPTYPTECGPTLFKMAQEALSNACQHSGGGRIRLRLSEHTLAVEDDGRGYDAATVKAGRGLRNLKQRAAEAGLNFEIVSSPQGTNVTINWEEETP